MDVDVNSVAHTEMTHLEVPIYSHDYPTMTVSHAPAQELSSESWNLINGEGLL
jgi:hypothetical protein